MLTSSPGSRPTRGCRPMGRAVAGARRISDTPGSTSRYASGGGAAAEVSCSRHKAGKGPNGGRLTRAPGLIRPQIRSDGVKNNGTVRDSPPFSTSQGRGPPVWAALLGAGTVEKWRSEPVFFFFFPTPPPRLARLTPRHGANFPLSRRPRWEPRPRHLRSRACRAACAARPGRRHRWWAGDRLPVTAGRRVKKRSHGICPDPFPDVPLLRAYISLPRGMTSRSGHGRWGPPALCGWGPPVSCGRAPPTQMIWLGPPTSPVCGGPNHAPTRPGVAGRRAVPIALARVTPYHIQYDAAAPSPCPPFFRAWRHDGGHRVGRPPRRARLPRPNRGGCFCRCRRVGCPLMGINGCQHNSFSPHPNLTLVFSVS